MLIYTGYVQFNNSEHTGESRISHVTKNQEYHMVILCFNKI
jgi:hypothetical protein